LEYKYIRRKEEQYILTKCYADYKWAVFKRFDIGNIISVYVYEYQIAGTILCPTSSHCGFKY